MCGKQPCINLQRPDSAQHSAQPLNTGSCGYNRVQQAPTEPSCRLMFSLLFVAPVFSQPHSSSSFPPVERRGVFLRPLGVWNSKQRQALSMAAAGKTSVQGGAGGVWETATRQWAGQPQTSFRSVASSYLCTYEQALDSCGARAASARQSAGHNCSMWCCVWVHVSCFAGGPDAGEAVKTAQQGRAQCTRWQQQES